MFAADCYARIEQLSRLADLYGMFHNVKTSTGCDMQRDDPYSVAPSLSSVKVDECVNLPQAQTPQDCRQ